MNLLDEKNKLLNDNLFKDWDLYTKLIKTQKYQDDIMNFLNALKMRINQTPVIDYHISRKFVGAYTMFKFDMFDKNITKDVELYYITKELIETFEQVFIDVNPNIELFFTKLTEYLTVFNKWKEQDEKELIDKSCTQQYKEIQVMEQKFTGDTPDEQQLSRSASILKHKFEHRIKAIGGLRGLQYVNDSPKLKPLDVMHIDMEENMKKAYWDMFEEDVNNNNLNPIGTNLDDFRKYLFELLGEGNKGNEIKRDFDRTLDLDLIKQMIESNALDAEGIYNIIKSLTWYVKKYVHSASEDEDTQILLNNVYKKMEEQKEKTGTILRYFFQNIFIKLDKTKVQIELLKL